MIMDLPTILSKFLIQEIDNEYQLYCEDESIRYNLISNLIDNHNYKFSYKVEYNTIYINRLTYNFLIKKAYESV